MKKENDATIDAGGMISSAIPVTSACADESAGDAPDYTDTRKLYERCLAKTSLMPDRAA